MLIALHGKITYKKSQVLQNNNYYAFGLQTSDSWTRVDTKPNQYLYNQASELNSNTGLYETPLRGYDPALGRFQGVDIMADMYSGFTPYQYADNQPVNKNDPTGAYADDNWWNAPRGLWGGRGDPSHWREQQRLNARSMDKRLIGDTQKSSFAKAGTLGFNYDSWMYGGTWETQETHTTIVATNHRPRFDPDREFDEELILDITVTKRVFVADPPADQQEGSCCGGDAMKVAMAASLVLLADDATVVGVVDDVAIPVLLGAAYLADKLPKNGAQYTLRARTSGLYPNYKWGSSVPIGTIYLNAGEIWKIGETMQYDPSSGKQSRYLQSELNGWNVNFVPEFIGNKPQIVIIGGDKIDQLLHGIW